MFPIICKKDKAEALLKQLQEYLSKGKIIKMMHVVSSNDDQIVVLVSDKTIDEQRASDWWSGYVAGMQQVLE